MACGIHSRIGAWEMQLNLSLRNTRSRARRWTSWHCPATQKAAAASDNGKFRAEIVPVEVPGRKGQAYIFDADETFRRDTSLEALGKLKPVFQKGGKVTAGNAPGLNDGAAAVVVASRAKAEDFGIKTHGTSGGLPPGGS